MVQLPEFKLSTYPTVFYQLKKPVYSLKQAPRASKLVSKCASLTILCSSRTTPKDNCSSKDNPLSSPNRLQNVQVRRFFVHLEQLHRTIIHHNLHVEDLFIEGEHIGDIEHTKKLLSSWFEMKDMKELNYFQGI